MQIVSQGVLGGPDESQPWADVLIHKGSNIKSPKDLEGSFSILGEKGTVEIGGFSMDALKTWEFATPAPEDDSVRRQFASNPTTFAYNHAEFLRDVVRSVREGRRGAVDGIEARSTLELINAIYESHETGRKVRLRFTPQLCKLGVTE